MKSIIFCCFVFVLFSYICQAAGQDPGALMVEMAPLAAMPADGDHFIFLSSEFELDKVVKGAPYSASVLTERVQQLADGNRITQRNTAEVFRDTEGRTRREQNFALIGPWTASSEEPPHTIFIHDPVSGADYVLDEKEKVARKISMRLLEKKEGPVSANETWEAAAPAAPEERRGMFSFYKETLHSKKESLGKKLIDGIMVEGTRTISTIPAGDIGNESPIEIISEKWYSPELQLHILTHHSDPRFGETTYRLTNISRREPDRSLFRVPSSYKIVDAPHPGKVIFQKRKETE